MKSWNPIGRALTLAVALVILPTAAWTQDQVIKPPATAVERLPAPKPAARQLVDGRIEVSWPAIEGAVKYQVWRSVPPTPQALVSPDQTDTTYIDSDVKFGSTYYYLVGAMGETGTPGLRAGTQPVTATRNVVGGALSAPVTITVNNTRLNPTSNTLTFPPSASGYHLERIIYRASATDPNVMDPNSAFAEPSGDIAPGATTQLNLIQGVIPTSRWVQYRITPIAGGPSGVSTLLLIPGVPPVTSGSTTTGTSSGSPTTGTSTATSTTAPAVGSAAGSATFVVAAPTTVAASATVTLPGAGTGARWLSLNDAVATVDASGVVTGRSRGTTQIVAISAAADGSLRVVTVPVTVSP